METVQGFGRILQSCEQRRLWQPWKDAVDDATKQSSTKQLPTAKWKRDRRSRLPEYSRKSDPKIPDANQEPDSPPPTTPQETQNNTPLDMTVRQRGLPPSYAQTINNPGFRSSYRPSVIQGSTLGSREELPPGISMCDPIIDEHFRRSLGNDYLTLYSNNNITKESSIKPPPPPLPPPPPPTTTKKLSTSAANVIELMDTAGLSVDDHFAKALGDTWAKLNSKKDEVKNGGTSAENKQQGLVTTI